MSANLRNKKRGSGKPGKASRGLVRIIAGKHRTRRLPVLVKEGLRPTSDRVKETLFNWLMNHISGANCLDMYAGSGGLGIEAISRGANHVCFIEQEKTAAEQIKKNLVTLREEQNAQVLNADALTSLQSANTQFDIVFIDPPFGQSLVEKSIQSLVDNNLLASNAWLYIEVAHSDNFSVPDSFVLQKNIKTSQVNAHLYRLEQ